MKLIRLIFFIFLFLSNNYLYGEIDLFSLKESYFRDNRYQEFIDYLKSLRKKKAVEDSEISYYIALTRFKQLKYLEEIQDWNEYFNYGDDYRRQISEELKKVVDTVSSKDKIKLYAYSLLWQFYNEQDPAEESKVKRKLLETCYLYAQESSDIEPIREIADIFLNYNNQTEASKLYQLYVRRLSNLEKDFRKIKELAQSYLDKSNIDLAIPLYDTYMERLLQQSEEDILKELLYIAKSFSFKKEGRYDLVYAEKVFKKIEELYGREVFDEASLYIRAYNLEKYKDYNGALNQYLEFIKRFPQSKNIDEVFFKIGIIYAYSLGDLEKAKSYFKNLAEKQEFSVYVASSLYQLGLILQWEKDNSGAKNYYSELLEKAKGDFEDLCNLVKERLKELDTDAPIDYNLRVFLDLSFGKDRIFERGFVDLKTDSFRIPKNKTIKIFASVSNLESGCMPIELNYLWSGDIYSYRPSNQQREFFISYLSSGTKIICLVLVTPAGFLDRTFLIIDVE
ncbi:MAG: hypothetical protein NC900_04655 [Candidatus Omnitrophica bacterium]|nr:hypothetical protein [Candidatus Omnitrophota bacterium]